RSISHVTDPSSATDSDTSGVSFRPDFDATKDSDSGEALNLTELITPEPTCLPNNRSRPLTYLNRLVRHLADASALTDFSDNPDDDIDKDIASVLLDYRRLDQTKVRARRIEKRWDNALLEWVDLVEALHEVTPNDVYRFFNYYMKLKYSEGGRFRDYYRRITRTRITTKDSEEINTEPVYVQDLTELNETILRTQEKRFHFRYERIQLYLFNILGIYTVNRLYTLLSLQFHYLRFSIQDNPEGGPPILLVEIKSEHIKQFLGTS
ncbi:hypothetical protein N7530_010759, partial [Penicillium desertorum]